MKRLAIVLCVVASVVCANAKILRVSNVNGSTAPYSSVTAALEAANDGDVIMLDASPYSYGYFVEINKSVTIQGPGFWLTENGIVQEGANSASFRAVRIAADGVKLISLEINNLSSNGHSNWTITRCKIGYSFDLNVKDNHVVIHQNYLATGIIGGMFGENNSSFLQITNNIILNGSTCNMTNSIVKYNTFGNSAVFGYFVKNSTVEYNIGLQNIHNEGSTYINNIEIPNGVIYDKNSDIDTVVKEKDASISRTHGAFAGEDPYVISGIASGPYIEDITVPVSVEQGDDMKVTLKIGKSR